jgi:hypothetical protein
MRLTPHFTLDELTFSETATRLGIDNTPSIEIRQNLIKLALGLEDVRTLLGYPIHISSGYRCIRLNNILKSKPTSAHIKGLAADFRCNGYGSPDSIVFAILNSDIPYDQIINEYDRWVHISFPENNQSPRKQALIIDKHGTTLYDKS